MKTTSTLAILATLALGTSLQASADVIVKADNNDALNLATSWEGGVVPGADDVAQWHPLTANETVAIGGPMSLLGLDLSLLGASKNLTLTGTDTLTLGREGIFNQNNNSKVSTTIKFPIALAADQMWRNPLKYGALNLEGQISLSNYSLTMVSGASIHFKNSVSGTGPIIVRGAVSYSNGAASPDADLIINGTGAVTFNQQPASGGGARAANVTLAGTAAYGGAGINVSGRSQENAHDVISGVLAVQPGYAYVSISPNGSKHATLHAATYRSGNGLILFRGTNLGTTLPGDEIGGASSILFGTAPNLVGGGGAAGTPSVSVLPWALGGTNTSDRGSTLATYDAVYGVRPLDVDTEFLAALPGAEDPLSNVRLISPGDGSAATYSVPDGTTTVNALILQPLGTAKGTGGIVVEGSGNATATLRVQSGLVYGREPMSDVSDVDANILQKFTLDFAGHRGCIVSQQTKQSNMNSSAPLTIRAAIANDGGEGVDFYATAENTGLTFLYGCPDSTYTGPTRVFNGNVRLIRKDNAGIPGDLEIWGGACLNNGNTIPDTADIRIYSGSLIQKGGASNSGSGTSETFRDLVMLGGSYDMGTDGTSSGSTTMRRATLFGGTLTSTSGHRHTVQGPLVLAGGTNIVRRSNWKGDQSMVMRSVQTLAEGIVITNTPFGAYAPMSFTAGTSIGQHGAKSTLSAGLVFVGNTTNDNTAVITSGIPSDDLDWPQFLLNGALVFNIGDGAADIDLRVEPQLVDNGTTAGSLQKTGVGTLALVNPANAHTGGTAVQAGTLVADGALAGDVSVAAGATFQAGSLGDSGQVALGGDLALADGARLRVRHEGTATTLGVVAGSVVSAGKAYVAVEGADVATLKSGIKFLEADSFSGTFVCIDPKVSVVKRNNGTELWLRANDGVVILVR